jgi:hypothetical protein
MKKFFSFSKLALVAILALCMVTLTACTAVQISTSIDLNEDGTGSRTISALIAKNDDNQDGYGSAYYYFKKHGDDLADYLKSAYKSAVPGSDEWLKISVDNSGSDWEVIDLTFDFTSFDDYKAKLESLAYDSAAAATYAAPELTIKDDGTATYTENVALLTAIFKSMQTTIMADKSIFDFNSTKDGKALNNGSADLKSLTDMGVEFMKPENGNAVTISLGSGKASSVEATDGVYTVTANYVASAATETTTDNTSAAVDNTTDIPKTGESYSLAIVALICLVGCGAVFMATKKRDTQRQ